MDSCRLPEAGPGSYRRTHPSADFWPRTAPAAAAARTHRPASPGRSRPATARAAGTDPSRTPADRPAAARAAAAAAPAAAAAAGSS